MKSRFLLLCLPALAAAAAFAARPQQEREPEEAVEMPVVGPTQEHEVLEHFAGTWETEVTMAMLPGETSKGSQVSKLSLGGLWLLGDYTGDFAGQPFAGHSVMGYDTDKEKYVSIWVDSVSARIEQLEGEWDAQAKKLSLVSEGIDPATGDAVRTEHVTTVVDEDHYVFEMNMPDAEGGSATVMTIHYRRKK